MTHPDVFPLVATFLVMAIAFGLLGIITFVLAKRGGTPEYYRPKSKWEGISDMCLTISLCMAIAAVVMGTSL